MLRTRTPLSLSRMTNTARLACVRPPASVHPEPGSNSPLYVCCPICSLKVILRFSFFLTFFGCICYFNDLFFFSLILTILISSDLRVQKYKVFLKPPNLFENFFETFFIKPDAIPFN